MEGTNETKACTCEGAVKSFDTAKGHGFIAQADLRVHRTVIQGEGAGPHHLAIDNRVRYEVDQGVTVPQTMKVRKL